MQVKGRKKINLKPNYSNKGSVVMLDDWQHRLLR